MKNFSYFIPTKVLFGFNSLRNLYKEKLPGKKALIVITRGKSISKYGYMDILKEQLEKSGVEWEIYNGVKPNPTLRNVEEGSKIAKKNSCDFIIGFGGGSAMDCAKSISIMATNEGSYWDYMGGLTGKGMEIKKDPLPVVCITTTAGTGSEVDPWTVITKEDTKEKLGFGYEKTYPVLSVVDPELMMTVPPAFTSYQGFDALFHAVESVLNKREHPMGEMFALKAVEYISKYLPRAVKNGSDREARYYVALANSLAGYFMMTISSHTFEHSISAINTEVPHGAGLIAISREYHSYFVKNEDNRDSYIKLAKAMGYSQSEDPNDFIKALEELKDKCLVKDVNLTTLNIKKEDIGELTELTYKLGGRKFENDPGLLNKNDIEAIFEKSFR